MAVYFDNSGLVGTFAGFNCGIVGSNLDFASAMLYLGLLPNQSTASTPQGHNQRFVTSSLSN
jgi:hypothetical protein